MLETLILTTTEDTGVCMFAPMPRMLLPSQRSQMLNSNCLPLYLLVREGFAETPPPNNEDGV